MRNLSVLKLSFLLILTVAIGSLAWLCQAEPQLPQYQSPSHSKDLSSTDASFPMRVAQEGKVVRQAVRTADLTVASTQQARSVGQRVDKRAATPAFSSFVTNSSWRASSKSDRGSIDASEPVGRLIALSTISAPLPLEQRPAMVSQGEPFVEATPSATPAYITNSGGDPGGDPSGPPLPLASGSLLLTLLAAGYAALRRAE